MAPVAATTLPEVDVCVVGSGAGGAPVAWECARAGMSVVVLEKGPRYQARDFVPHDEILHCRRDFFVPFERDEPHLLARDGAATAARTRFGWTAACVGGGTMHMTGLFFRLRPEDMRLRAALGAPEGADVADWPVAYEALAPFYEEVEDYLGLSGADDELPAEWRRGRAFPLGPVVAHPLKNVLMDAARAQGLHPFTTPRAILGAPYRGRAGCTYCHFCGSYGCEVDAKSSALVTWLRDAEATGHCEVRARAMAARIETDADGRARRVVYLTPGGERVQPARVVVVACTAVESARLLLNSASAAHPHGLANESGLVGRHLTFSTGGTVRGVFRYARSPVPEAVLRSPGMFVDASFQDAYVARGAGLPYPKAGTVQLNLMHTNPIYHALEVALETSPPRFGKALKDALRDRVRGGRTIEAESFCEFLPNAGTRVTVDASVADRFGLPAARIDLRHHPADLAASRHLQSLAEKVLRAAGADPVVVLHPGEADYLQHGTCRFGEDPAASVLDPNCRAHETKNLFVTDASFMPTSGGVPPTLTIMANAVRVARFLVAESRAGRL
jgi:choline dehydrogenase-like flavoprotein